MYVSKLISSSNNYGGIYKAILVDINNELRIIVPCLHNDIPITIKDDKTYELNIIEYDKLKNTYPEPMWNVPNMQAQNHEKPIHPCWVTFENGIVSRPIIMGWLGKGIMYHSLNNNIN